MGNKFFSENMYEEVEEREDNEQSVEELIIKYQKRYMTQLATDTHTQFTFLFENKLRKRLDNVMYSIAVDNGKNYTNEESFKTMRRFLKGFKFKFINTAVEYMLDQYEKENGKVGNIECITYEVKEGINEKVYIIEEDGEYTLSFHNRDGEEIDGVTGVDSEYVQEMIKKLEKRMVKVGRKSKKEVLGSRYI